MNEHDKSLKNNNAPHTRSLKIKFSLIQFTFWCSWCAFTSFAALYFKNKGLSQSQIGFAISISTLSGILGQIFWGFICDRFKTIKKAFIAANLMIWSVILLFLFSDKALVFMILMGLLGFAQIPQPSVLDTWVLKKMPRHKSEYGHIRLWASIGFALFALGFGKIIDFFGFSVLFIAPSVFLFITLTISFITPEIEHEGSGKKRNLKSAYHELRSNKRFIFFIGVCFLIGLAARTTHLLLPLIIDAVKGSAAFLGLALFVTGIAEIPMLILSERLSKKIKPLNLIMISAFFYLLQFTILYLARSSIVILLAMVFQGMAFGNLLPSIRLFVYENAPDCLRTTAQTITDGIVSSLAGVIGSAAGGIIIQHYGLRTLIAICFLLIASALLILFLRNWLRSKKHG